MEQIYCSYEAREGKNGFWATFYTVEPTKWVYAYPVDNAEKALPWFKQIFELGIAMNLTADERYQTENGRQEMMRQLSEKTNATPAPAIETVTTAKPVEMVKCSCGHTVPRSQIMSASMGTSCPDCYDRMSD